MKVINSGENIIFEETGEIIFRGGSLEKTVDLNNVKTGGVITIGLLQSINGARGARIIKKSNGIRIEYTGCYDPTLTWPLDDQYKFWTEEGESFPYVAQA